MKKNNCGLPYLNSGEPLMAIPGTEIGLVLQTTGQANFNDHWLLTEEEYQACDGDNEELLIAQHNKTLKTLEVDGYFSK